MTTIWTAEAPPFPPELEGLGVTISAFTKLAGGAYRRVEPAADTYVMILGVGAPWIMGAVGGEPAAERFACVGGLHGKAHLVTSQTAAGCVEVRIPGWLAIGLLGFRMDAKDSIASLAETMGPQGCDLEEAVATAPTAAAAAAIVVHALSARLKSGDVDHNREIAFACRKIARAKGRVRVQTLADDIGWSARHFSKRFKDQVGVDPKQAARLSRFNAAYAQVAGSRAGLAEIALATGYADQSHMSREFCEFASATPGAVRRDAGRDVEIVAFESC
jgi:AraC-like DNA-binding protein